MARCRTRRLVAAAAVHVFLAAASYLLAAAMRFDFAFPPAHQARLLLALPIVAIIRAATFASTGLLRSSWRHTDVVDLRKIVEANTIASVLILPSLFIPGLLGGFPRSILLLDWIVSLLLVSGARMVFRLGFERRDQSGVARIATTDALIIGAGNAGERLVRDLLHDQSAGLRPVGLIDDDPTKLHLLVHGVPVLGSTSELANIATSTGVRDAVLAIPSADGEVLERIHRRCRAASIRCRIVPSLAELLSGSSELRNLRDVQLEDLLGRRPVQLDLSRVRDAIAGRTVLVTGGAGSIGSELARQLATFRPLRLILVDQSESPLYFVHLEIERIHPEVEVVPCIGDVADRERMAAILSWCRPAFVFHAAAYKHVPLMEHNVAEAVRNNVFGTLCVAEMAARCDVATFVLISTDKAVRPSSVMGATKRVAERLVLGLPALSRTRTDFRAVRFGNVLGSAGSVIPLFKQQLERGGPLTVTHPDVTRYFMTIPEASQLVLVASVLPEAAGRISMLEMGKPVKICELAEKLIRMSGLQPGSDVVVKYTGLRPGEKLTEELMSAVEATVPTESEKIHVVANTSDSKAGDSLQAELATLLSATDMGREDEILRALIEMVPECVRPLRQRGRPLQRHSDHGCPCDEVCAQPPTESRKRV